jgi:cell division protein FtsI/penicillin-binding protein 2
MMSGQWRQWFKGQLTLALLVVIFLVVLCRCWQLQIHRHDYFVKRADRQQLKIIPQSARRGLIVDRRGQILAVSIRRPSLRLDPYLIKDTARMARNLGTALNLDADELHRKILGRKNKRFLWIKRFLTDRQLERVQEIDLRGLVIEQEYQRQYPMGQLAAHVIGFTDIDGKGLEGIEASYDDFLRCEPGRWRLRSDVKRRPILPQGPCDVGQDGKIVVLTIDANIQAFVEEQLKKTVLKFNARGGTGLVMVPKTGEVLAMANYPSFHPGQARKTPGRLRRNRALTDPVEPGSLFKPFTIASALEGNFVTLDDTINCLDGPYSSKGIGTIREYKYYFGNLSVADVIARSSNIGTAKIAQKMGKNFFFPMIEKFGFGHKTGIDLGGEGSGILMPLHKWKWGQYALTRASYGQGPIAATPIQMIHGFSTLANGGKKIRPRVARGVLSSDGREVVKNFFFIATDSSTEGEQVVSSENCSELINRALTAVVARVGGTAHNAHLEDYTVFGKTGTAQVPRKEGRGYYPNKYTSSFVGGAPAADPQVCVLVMVYEPDKSLGLGYTGGAVSATAVGEIIQYSLAYLDVEAEDQALEVAAGF